MSARVWLGFSDLLHSPQPIALDPEKPCQATLGEHVGRISPSLTLRP
jgi:hypothetical protein